MKKEEIKVEINGEEKTFVAPIPEDMYDLS